MTSQDSDLPTPIQTQWIAIAGGACSGKTTLAEKLKQHLGWELIPDYGRQVFQNALDNGLSPKDFAENASYFQEKITHYYIQDCEQRATRHRVISDYGLPCVYAWCRAKNVEPPQALVRGCDEWRYDKVFMLSPLPMKIDGVRDEAVQLKERVIEEIEKAYRYFGYDVVQVPVFDDDPATSIKKRFEFILSHIQSDSETSEEANKNFKEDIIREVA